MQVRGRIAVSFPDGTAVLGPRDLFLANPFQVHSLVGHSPDSLTLALQVDLSDPGLLPAQYHGRRFSPVADWPPAVETTVREKLEALARELADQQDGFPLACLSSLTALLATLVREAAAPGGGRRESDDPVHLERVRAVISYLQANCTRSVSLDELAEHVALSRYYVSHLVKAATGLSIQENLGLIRTNRAIQRMFATDARLVDIAMDAGFSHLKYFNKYFRRLYGETPSQARTRAVWREAVLSGSADRVQAPSRELAALMSSAG